jgi:glycosyltransferase involved in cell wall biosynthesis
MGCPTVTVLMPVHNSGRFLVRAVESILSQTFVDIEFIIINDGSTDGTRDVLESYKDSRIRLIHQDNMGVTLSLNKGINLSRGKFIARMDGDDISLESRLEEQVEVLKRHNNLALVGCHFHIIDEEDRVLRTVIPPGNGAYRLWRLHFGNTYAHASVMIRKEVLLGVGKYDQKYQCSQDYDLWLRLSNRQNTYVIPKVLFLYRASSNGDQISASHGKEQDDNTILIGSRAMKLCNPSLSHADCLDIWPLYWKRKNHRLTLQGLKAIEPTFDGFCKRYRITSDEIPELKRQIALDMLNAISRPPHNSPIKRLRMIIEVLKRLYCSLMRCALQDGRAWLTRMTSGA